MKLSNLTDEQIYAAIEAMQNGIAVKPNSEESAALEISIKRAYAELERRANQKKSEPAQLESKATPEKIEKAKEAKRIFEEQVGGLLSKSQPAPKTESTFMRIAGVVASVVAPAPIAEPYVSVRLVSGDFVDMNLSELRSQARKYFTQIVDGAAMESGNKAKVMASVQYRNLCAFVAGIEVLTEEKPTVQDLHIRHSQHGEVVKARAVDLLNMIYDK